MKIQANSVSCVSNPATANVVELSESEKKLVSTLGITALSAIRPILNILISQVRTMIVVQTKRKLKNAMSTRLIIKELEQVGRASMFLGGATDWIDRLPIEVVKGIPPLYDLINNLKQDIRRTDAEVRNMNYKIKMLNNKQFAYDSALIELDEQLRKLKGMLDFVESELERGTA